MSKKISRQLFGFLLLLGLLFFAQFAFAQGFGVNEVSNGLDGSLTATDPRTLAGRIINIILGFLGLIAVTLAIYAGYLWMSSNGDEEKIENAKKILRNSVIGLVIILSSWAIATYLITKLGGAINPGSGACLEGQISSCGCGGSMVCSGGSFGACVGSDCSGGGIKPSSCDGSANPGCQATSQICALSDYCDANDCACKPKGSLGDACDSNTTNATCEADNNRCSEYLSCSVDSCTCVGQPVITGLSPVGGFCTENINKSCISDADCAALCDVKTPNGKTDNFITILGKNFGEYSATSSKVIFSGADHTLATGVAGRQPNSLNIACINTWRDDQIVIAIPGGANYGPLSVVNQDGQSDTTNNDYGPALPDFQKNNVTRPGLCYLNPQAGVLSDQVSYQGINLFASEAYFGNYQNNVAALESQFINNTGFTGTSTIPNIRPGDSGSFVQNNSNGQPEKSNYLLFVKQADPGSGPFISSFYPTAGVAGQYVTIRGKGFGGTRGLNHVYFGGLEAAYDFPDVCLSSVWKDDQVIVKVPTGLSNGPQAIQVKIATTTIDTQKLNPNVFQADDSLDLKSSLCKIDPERGPPLTPVTLWGEYFGGVNSEGLVKFNLEKVATGTIKKIGKADMIETAVPVGAVSGPVKVVNNSTSGNELNFNVGQCTVDADCGTQICCPVNTYKAGRCLPALINCSSEIPTSVFEWKFNTGFGTSTCVGPDCLDNDPCAEFITAEECGQQTACCFDSKATASLADDVCRSGSAISSGTDAGYCAYYDCDTVNITQCATSTPLKIGAYFGQANCLDECAKDDPCSSLTSVATCEQNNRCCFDAKKTIDAADDTCRLGGAISSGADQGYCSYYECDTTQPYNSSGTPYNSSGVPSTSLTTQCATSTPVKIGTYSNLDSCVRWCATSPSGAGLSCAGITASSTCNTSICNYPGLGCVTADGNFSATGPNCGACCCQPGTIDLLSGWKCLADKGNCTGASRGLFCGCSRDDECGAKETIGCGADTCCTARPEITGTNPPHLADKVCRNVVLEINFNETMSAASASGNVLLLEEKDYGDGVCPTGTFVAQGNSVSDILVSKNKNWLARLWDKLSTFTINLSKHWSSQAVAGIPDPSKLYCSVKGTVAVENKAESAILSFTPQRLLSAAANYYLIIKGDEALNSKTGVLSAQAVGFNGLGYLDPTTNAYVAGSLIKFNNISYTNSQIIKFTTLSDQSGNAGICLIDEVKVSPDSYLFKTTANDLNEKDDRGSNTTFDTVADRDKVFTANAYSSDGQTLRPVSGYFWDWNFQTANANAVDLNSVPNLTNNKILVSAISGQTDATTNVTATIDMSSFKSPACVNNCNVYTGGDGFKGVADVYIFVCDNPWPPVKASGSWSPWTDNCQNALGNNCVNYNYKFYYCRDSGASGTLDDLPAIINQAVVRGVSTNLICSANRSSCSVLNSSCGPDNNGDGVSDGLCLWNVLKESYFFREAVLTGAEMTSAINLGTSNTVQISWRSNSDQVASYKIYYLMSGQGTMLSKTVKVADVCSVAGNINTCQTAISGLTNDQAYIFKVSALSVNSTESQLSNGLTAIPTDRISPAIPRNFQAVASPTTLKFTWSANNSETVTSRLYHGTLSGLYGESFDSVPGGTSLSFPLNQFATSSLQYFALSALDQSGNESAKSAAWSCLNGECAVVINVQE